MKSESQKMLMEEFYSKQIEIYEIEKERASKRVFLLGSLRLLVFSIVVVGWIFFGWNPIVLTISLIGFALFLFLLHLSTDAKYFRSRAEKLLEINRAELKVLEGDWTSFNDGRQYIDSKHPFSGDIDLFGPKSLFQLLNRTVSRKGERMLAFKLAYENQDPELTNEAIKEFTEHPDWTQQFRAEAMINKEEVQEIDLDQINKIEYSYGLQDQIMIVLVPLIAISSITLYSLDIINGFILSGAIAINLSFAGKNLKKANKVFFGVSRYERVVNVYMKQLQLLEKLPVSSEQMSKWKNETIGDNGEPILALRELNKIQERINFRWNLLVGVLLNFLFAWDFRILREFEQWKMKYSSSVSRIEEKLAELEFWISGSVYLNNNQDAVFAEFSENAGVIVEGMRHPFIPLSKVVRNELELKNEECFHIVTGPNMAGKSTYLRGVAWVFVSANAGLPVLAKQCKLPRLKLYTSMRTVDDLSGSSSYFYAELSRLRFIMNAIENGEKVFVILDEILKGTNSKDKEEGSAAFLKKMSRIGGRGIIATHDLSLCRLSEESLVYRNRYFDSTISNDNLSFDYTIRDGICQNMNASFLLKRMDLID